MAHIILDWKIHLSQQVYSDVTLTPHDGRWRWISYQLLAFLSNFSRWQLIQNLAPSTIVWRQCDIRITIPSSNVWKHSQDFATPFWALNSIWQSTIGDLRFGMQIIWLIKHLMTHKRKFSTTTINDRQLSHQKIHQKISVIKTNSFDWELLTFHGIKKIVPFGILIHVLSWKQKCL